MNLVKNKNVPPGPKGNLILGNALGFVKDPINFMMKNTDAWGDIIYFRFFHYKTYFINHPDYIQQVMQENNRKYVKSPGYNPLKLLIGNGIFTSEGNFWLKQRRMYQPAFNKDNIKIYSNAVIESSNALIQRWEMFNQKDIPINISQEMMKITLEIIGKTLFSTDVSSVTNTVWHSLTLALKFINNRTKYNPFNLPISFPTPNNLRFAKALRLLDNVIFEIIEKRRKSSFQYDDLLSRLMNSRDEESVTQMDDKQLRDEVMTVFLAGHETSANVLTWTLYFLSKYPETEYKVYEEIKNNLGERIVVYDDLPKFVYTTQVLKEIMRLYPPVWLLGRQSIEEDFIDGFKIPKGMHLRISPYVLHRHPKFWNNPEKFDPDRFVNDKEKKLHKFAYIPFGAGPRLCIGQNFAMIEMLIITLLIVQKYKLALVPDQSTEIGQLITLRPKYDILITLKNRN